MDTAIYESIPRGDNIKTDREIIVHPDGSRSVTECTYRDRTYFAEIISRRHDELKPASQ
ncbi:hypothetical protein [Bradyrhizobium genosp. P]|uniref:hypothetical protein n=1 Tax=Bradyrhizobium genosp. P TaxID=83641 RepID=UPI003CF44DF8